MRTSRDLLNGKGYYYAFLAGAKKILENQKELNRINVFPVPDADTGTNLASTLRAVIERVRPQRSYAATSTAIAAAALEGARGNSGVIFAQFLYGLGVESRNCPEISLPRFAPDLRQAVRHMYAAIAEPVEGTMITVLRRWAEYLESRKEETENLRRLLSDSCELAREALQETRHRLEAMKKAGVVDAGSKGVVLFLEGAIDFLIKPSHKKIVSLRSAAVELEETESVSTDPAVRRYCTEALIRPHPGGEGGGLDKDALKSAVLEFGDSLVIAGSQDALRLHLHTNNPAEMFYRIRKFGVLAQQKADDMKRQYEASHARLHPVALVTDSACDLPAEILDRHQVHMIPLHLNFGESAFLDKVTVSPDRFYTMLDEEREFPKTAQPNAKTFEDLYSRLAAHYDSILSIHLSSKLSGTYSSAAAAAERVMKATGKTITVVDSKTLSGALGLVVLRTARLIEAGATQAEAAAEAERVLGRSKILVGVRTLKYMVRGGRVSPMAGKIANVLNLKPIVSMKENGESTIFDKAFSQRGNLRNTLKHLRKAAAVSRVWEYGVLHAHNPEDAAAYARETEAIFGKKPAFIMDISPVIGLNAGVGAVAVSYLLEE
ncbi:MAG: DegV family EDD domain-containing protein [Candidatus Aminicenantes bacterium]|nr:DegV family EDD domain-containing protein [Candidatus Aminicenantes bacterium]